MSGLQCVNLRNPDAPANLSCAADDAFITEVPEAELHIFPADENRNQGIGAVICPGGGYGGLSLGPEGHLCAMWLASVGITGMVLKYRLPGGNKTVPFEDMHAAMHYARANAANIGFMPEKLGVIGFSAGGHLASMAASVFTERRLRPDFSILFYPVTGMEKRKRGMTRLNLLGRHAPEEDLQYYSSHLRVTENTPPTLLFLCDDDPMVPPRHSILYYEALKANNVPASMHIFPTGGHAWGFRGINQDGERFRYGDTVKAMLFDWALKTGSAPSLP